MDYVHINFISMLRVDPEISHLINAMKGVRGVQCTPVDNLTIKNSLDLNFQGNWHLPSNMNLWLIPW